jgi:hypothetical protein
MPKETWAGQIRITICSNLVLLIAERNARKRKKGGAERTRFLVFSASFFVFFGSILLSSLVSAWAEAHPTYRRPSAFIGGLSRHEEMAGFSFSGQRESL